MWPKTLIFLAVYMGFCTNLFGGEKRETPITAQELIQGVIARSEAVFSCKMDYRQKCGFANIGKIIDEGEYKAVASGSSWRLYYKRLVSEIPSSPAAGAKPQADAPSLEGFFENTQLSHRGKFIKYTVTPQFDASLRNVADIINERPISFLYKTYNGPPLFAGSFWFDCTKDFILNRKNKAVRKPDTEVNGVKAQVLEWEVSDAEKFNAFHAANRGGFLRLYVSSELGFVLPRIENVGPDGLIDTVYDSSDFKESAPGIIIPRYCRIQDYNHRKPGFYVEYEITRVAQLNEQIPDSEFIVHLPAGTLVSDSRAGKSSIFFEIQQGGPIPEGLEDIIAIKSPPFWGRNWHSALMVGIGGGVLLLAILVLWRRGLLRRRSP